MTIAVVILTYNEEIHVQRALDSVKPFATQVFVIDSFSTDRTIEMAEKAGAVVLQNPWINHSNQFQWGIDNAPITAEWIMRLDADEVIEADLAEEIISRVPDLPKDVTGIELQRKHIFMGRWIRHGGRYPLKLLRIWRSGIGRMEMRWMDEHVLLSSGSTVTFNGGFADANLRDLTYFISKHNSYATKEAIQILLDEQLTVCRAETVRRPSGQAGIKRRIKQIIYTKMPFQWGPLFYFIFRYIVQRGFLDGKPGLVYHFLQGYWYRFLVESKIYELRLATNGLNRATDILSEISRLTGHDVSAECRLKTQVHEHSKRAGGH